MNQLFPPKPEYVDYTSKIKITIPRICHAPIIPLQIIIKPSLDWTVKKLSMKLVSVRGWSGWGVRFTVYVRYIFK